MSGRGMAMVSVFIVVAALLHCASAQTRHIVGDSSGWRVPAGSAASYSTWSSRKTFTVGDTLVFNFVRGAHDVAKVTKAAFDSCNLTNPISRLTNGPATITIDSTGEHFFICTLHCDLGQKLAINVSASSTAPSASPPALSPASPPSIAPSPVATAPESAAPSPSRAPETHVVGDQMGWFVPPARNAYATWASKKTFRTGDTLVFNFSSGAHNVAEVTKAAYDACTTTNSISTETTSPARITLDSQGKRYFICTVGQHCQFGQKLAINVSSGSGGTATPPSSTTTSPSPVPTTGGSAPPPPSSSASSLTVASIYVAFFAMAGALLF